MIQPPNDKVVIKVNSKYIQHMSNILRLSSLENNSSVDPADFVSIVGDVVSLPKTINKKGLAFDGLSVGDVAIFSYQVIYDIIMKEGTDKLVFRNMVDYHGTEYFLADISKIFGYIRNEQITMINDWVMLTEYPKSVIVMQNQNKKTKGTVTSKIISIQENNSLNLKETDEVMFSPFKPQHYQINKKPFIILKKQHILGKV